MIQLTFPAIMGIWNVTPDSFSSRCDLDGASTREHAMRLCKEGADILDIGAESTRPGAIPVSPDEEIERLIDPLKWARSALTCPISLDSRHVQTIRWALEHQYVDIINDVGESEYPTQSRECELYRMAADYRVKLILMAWNDHQTEPSSFDICIKKIYDQLQMRIEFALESGVDLSQIIVDPGIGFGKGLDNDLRLITEAPGYLKPLGCPVLIAHSRKRCLAKATGLPLESLDVPTAIASSAAFAKGADIVRVHEPALSAIAKRLIKQ